MTKKIKHYILNINSIIILILLNFENKDGIQLNSIYRGSGWSSTEIGGYKDGNIYSGRGWSSTKVGEYRDGNIYRGTGWSSTKVGEYRDGSIYRGTGWSSTKVGEYTGYSGGPAAAFLLLFD